MWPAEYKAEWLHAESGEEHKNTYRASFLTRRRKPDKQTPELCTKDKEELMKKLRECQRKNGELKKQVFSFDVEDESGEVDSGEVDFPLLREGMIDSLVERLRKPVS